MVVEFDVDADFVGECGGWWGEVDAVAASAEALAGAFDVDLACVLCPACAMVGLPELWVEFADGEPAVHGDGVGALDEEFELVDGVCEAEVFGDGGFEGDDALDVAVAVEDGAAAVAFFDGDGEL